MCVLQELEKQLVDSAEQQEQLMTNHTTNLESLVEVQRKRLRAMDASFLTQLQVSSALFIMAVLSSRFTPLSASVPIACMLYSLQTLEQRLVTLPAHHNQAFQA